MSECAKASQYAFFFFKYLYIQRVFWGREILYFQGALLKMQPLARFNAFCSGLALAPVLYQSWSRQIGSRGESWVLRVFSAHFSPLLSTLHGLVLQKPKHLPCSTCFCWGWGKLQGDSVRWWGVYVCKCMVACVHECSHAWIWCAPGCLLPVLGEGRGHNGVWLWVLSENVGI